MFDAMFGTIFDNIFDAIFATHIHTYTKFKLISESFTQSLPISPHSDALFTQLLFFLLLSPSE